MPRHANKTSFKKGDKRLIGIKQSKEHIEKRTFAFRKRVSVKCDNCGNNIDIISFKKENSKHHFCNWNCYTTWQKKTNWFYLRNYNLTEKGRMILSEEKKGNKNPRIKIWQGMSEEDRRKWMNEMRRKASIRPTKPEIKMMKIIDKYNLPYKYVGDGQFWIGRYNPDFINTNHQKIAIEVFGDYWHKDDKGERKKVFEKYGWNCIIVWESELNNLDKKQIIEKIMGGELNGTIQIRT